MSVCPNCGAAGNGEKFSDGVPYDDAFVPA